MKTVLAHVTGIVFTLRPHWNQVWDDSSVFVAEGLPLGSTFLLRERFPVETQRGVGELRSVHTQSFPNPRFTVRFCFPLQPYRGYGDGIAADFTAALAVSVLSELLKKDFILHSQD